MAINTPQWLGSPTSWLEFSRENLLHNLARVRGLVGGTKIMAVLKANAYGAGAREMAGALAAAGVGMFGVATVAEGVALRQCGIAGMLLCLAFFTRDEVEAIVDHELTPAVFTPEAAQVLARCGQARRRRISVWVKIDTGLGRLGVPIAEAVHFVREIGQMPALSLAGLFSTLTENPDRDPIQVQRLLEVRRALPQAPGPGGCETLLSLASSNGILSLPASYLDVVRAGIVLHGLEPSEPKRMDARLVEQADLRPIATWKTRVVQERTHAAGEQVGYGSRPALATAARMATLAIGWADGYPAAMSQGGAVLIRGSRCPILSVSANSTVVRVVDDGAVDADDEVVLLGSQGDASITAWEMARISRGSVYRLLAAVPESVPRRWG